MKKAIKYTVFKTRWGYFGLAGTDKGLLRSHLPASRYGQVRCRLLAGLPLSRFQKDFFKLIQQQIAVYFEGSFVSFSKNIPLELDGFSDFVRLVLTACRDITFGQTTSYGELAKKLGRPAISRAVGGALAKNPLPLIIPCHRVVCRDGKIGGFSTPGGKTIKKRMLELEQKALSSKFSKIFC